MSCREENIYEGSDVGVGKSFVKKKTYFKMLNIFSTLRKGNMYLLEEARCFIFLTKAAET